VEEAHGLEGLGAAGAAVELVGLEDEERAHSGIERTTLADGADFLHTAGT